MGGMAHVELVEGEHGRPDPGRGDADRAADDEPDARPAPARRRRRWFVLAAVGVLVLGLVGAQVLVDAHERARATRLARVPGVLATLGPDARQLWRSSPGYGLGVDLRGLPMPVGESLLVGTVEADGTVQLGAVDPGSGRRLWSVTAAAEPGGVAEAAALGSVSCAAAVTPEQSDPDGATAACTVAIPTGYVEVGGTAQPAQFATSRAALLLVDVATGEITHRVDPPAGTSVRDAPGGYLTATQDVDGGEVVERFTWGSTTPTWSVRTGPPADAEPEGAAASSAALGSSPVTMLVDAEHVALSTRGAAWLLDASDGSVLDASSGRPGVDATIALLPAGGFLASWFDGSGAASRVLAGDGTLELMPDTLGPLATVDDGSGGDLVLVAEVSRGSSPLALVGLDARTGERRWRSTEPFGWSIVLIDGVACTSDGGHLSAVDLDDGSVRWRRAIERSETRLLTDGTAAILVGQGRVDAYALHDGAPLWSSVVVRTDDSARLEPVTGGPGAVPTVTDGTTDTSSWAAVVGRHLALVSPSAEITVLG